MHQEVSINNWLCQLKTCKLSIVSDISLFLQQNEKEKMKNKTKTKAKKYSERTRNIWIEVGFIHMSAKI